MTGTAKTEATEFTEIYGLNIVTVPTNRPNIRKDYPDAVYKTSTASTRLSSSRCWNATRTVSRFWWVPSA